MVSSHILHLHRHRHNFLIIELFVKAKNEKNQSSTVEVIATLSQSHTKGYFTVIKNKDLRVGEATKMCVIHYVVGRNNSNLLENMHAYHSSIKIILY